MLKAEKTRILSQTPIFSSLEISELDDLASAARPRKLKRGEILFLQGEPADRLFVVVSGALRAFRVNAKGREQVIHIERAGATLAEVPVFDDGPYPATAAAEEPSVVLSISRIDFKQICFRNPNVAWAALGLLAGRLRRHAELINELALHDVGPRLVRFLLAEAKQRGQAGPEGVRVKLSLTHQQVAGRIGSVREVVSRILSRLENDGLISLEGQVNGAKGYVVVLHDETSLQLYAEGR